MEEGALFGFALSMKNAKSLRAISISFKEVIIWAPTSNWCPRNPRLGLIRQASLSVRIESTTSYL